MVFSPQSILFVALFAGGVALYLQKGQETLDGSLKASITGLGQELSPSLKGIAAVVNKCLVSLSGEETPCPRLIMVTEDPSPGSPRSRFAHFRGDILRKLLGKKGETKRKCYRVRFLCAHDLSAANCGDDGQGYKVEIKDWQKWLQRFLPLIQVSEKMKCHWLTYRCCIAIGNVNRFWSA